MKCKVTCFVTLSLVTERSRNVKEVSTQVYLERSLKAQPDIVDKPDILIQLLLIRFLLEFILSEVEMQEVKRSLPSQGML